MSPHSSPGELQPLLQNMDIDKKNPDIEAGRESPTIEPTLPTNNVDAKADDYENRNVGTLNRRLKSRHVQFLALSGAIGTGLFVGSGQVLSLAGPLSAFLAYTVTGFNIYCVLNSVVALITLFYFTMVILNCLPVRIYGEAEFVFGAIKLLTIVGLIILMFIITVGGGPSGEAIGFRYWNHPGPMNEYLKDGALGRFLAFVKVFITATFSYGGSEMVVMASGETENPRRNIPKAIRRVFWRIAIFYVLSIFLVGLCVSSKDPNLLNAINKSAPGAAQSPFVIAIRNSGIKILPSIINAVILTSAWSSGNSLFYAATRVLYAAALDGKAPRILTWERFGVPYLCVGVTTIFGLLVYLNVSNSGSEVFFWLSNLSGVGALIIWASVSFTYLRFYYCLSHHGIDRNTLPFKSPFQPFLAYFSFCFCTIVAVFNGFDAFFPGRFSAKTFLPPYINIPIFLVLIFGYKWIKKSKYVKYSEMDLWSGKAEIDRLEHTWPIVQPRNWLERIWFWIA
ncbi:hypothetical protein H9Q72_009425 [Fusarium xylarioides]|uniref:Amino acid permease/ SLC12A domain-containing protein n=1 Tax=Fusarium xylarioides TaxID=221167 RepID=A0A9P7KYV7_9HYPO|nr:hypothetical protein H9Q72_009425 [Fusarium xylarioides]